MEKDEVEGVTTTTTTRGPKSKMRTRKVEQVEPEPVLRTRFDAKGNALPLGL